MCDATDAGRENRHKGRDQPFRSALWATMPVANLTEPEPVGGNYRASNRILAILRDIVTPDLATVVSQKHFLRTPLGIGILGQPLVYSRMMDAFRKKKSL